MNALLPIPSLPDELFVPRLDASSNGMLMTPDEFDAVPEWNENYRYELINGVVVVSPAVTVSEADPNEELGHLLRTYQESHPQGAALDFTVDERDVRVGEKTVRRCDRALWIGLGRLPDVKNDIPAIIVEFVSRGKRNRTRDYVHKRSEYLSAGVKEYWVINRFTKTTHVFSAPLDANLERLVPENENYATPLLPSFELPLSRILAKALRWDK
jgi:Uma2 family endonuclease